MAAHPIARPTMGETLATQIVLFVAAAVIINNLVGRREAAQGRRQSHGDLIV